MGEASSAELAPTAKAAISKEEVEIRARNIMRNVRCLTCPNQNIEDAQTNIAILLRKMIRDEVASGKQEKEVYKSLQDQYGETVLYTPPFDSQTAVLYLLPLIMLGGAAGISLLSKRRQPQTADLARSMLRGIPLTQEEHQALTKLVRFPKQR